MAFKTVASSSKTILDITDAYSVLLTNDSYSVVCDKDGNAVAGELGSSGKAKTTVTVYKGNNSLTGVASNPGLNQFSYSIATQTGCTAARTDNSTFYINTVSADSGSVTVTVNVENETSFTKIFTFGKSKTGADGIKAKLVSLTGSGQTFLKNTSGVISPATITVTAEVQNTAVTDWTYSVDGAAFLATVPTGVSRTGSTVTITGSTMTVKSIVVKASDGTYSDVYTVSKIEDGGNALSPVISNSSHTVPASSGGTVSSYSGSGTTIQVFEGATPLIFHTTIANGRFTIGTPTISPASKITVGAISGSGTTTATVAAHSAMDGVTDSVVITYPITARRADGTQTTFSVTQTITKSKTGEKGDNGANGSNGADGYTVILTSESHTFAGSTTAALAGTATSNVIVYKGATQIASSITSITGLVTGLTAPITGNGTTSNYFTATATTALVARNGELTVNISADGKTFVKKFTFTVTRDGTNGNPGSPGSPGTPAKLVDIVPSALYFVTNTVGTDPSTYVYAPSSIALTPTFQSCTYSKWEYSVNGSTWTTITTQNGLSINSTSKVLTVSSSSTLFNSTQTFLIFKCSSTTGEADVVTLNRIFESGALGGRLSTAESLITQNANQIALRVTETQVTDKINAIQIGGRNLLLKSDTPVTNSSYPAQRYDLTEKMSASKTYTIRLWGTLGVGKTSFTPYLNGGSISLGTMINNGDGTFSLTFVGKDSGVTTGDFINIYPMPSGTVVDSTIKKIKLEVGTKATDHTNAPEDDQQYVNDVVGQMTQELNSTMEQTSASLRTEISEQYYTKGRTDQLVSVVGTELEQTKTAFNFQFTEITKNINNIQAGNDAEFSEIKKYIRFENGDIVLGESTNSVTVRLENNQLAFYVGGIKVSYWLVDETGANPPKFYVTDGEFLNSLRLGSFAWTPRANGNLSFGKVI